MTTAAQFFLRQDALVLPLINCLMAVAMCWLFIPAIRKARAASDTEHARRLTVVLVLECLIITASPALRLARHP